MSFLLMPISFFTKEYIAGFLTIPLILIVSALVYNFFAGQRNFHIHPYIYTLVAGLVLIQAVINIAASTQFANYDSWAHFFQFIKIIVLIFLNYIFIRQTLTNRRQLTQFLKGTIIFIGMAICVGLVQIIYVRTSYLKSTVSFIGKFLEATWSQGLFYQSGSYVETTTRINGLSQEASVFASQIGILGFPLLLALLKNKFCLFFKWKNGNYIFYMALFLFLSALSIFIKSTSGLIFLILSWSILFLNIFNHKNKKIQLISFAGVMLILIVCVFIYFFGDSDVRHFLNDYLVKKASNDSGINRTAITCGLFKIFLQHPFAGVGYSGAYLFEAVSAQANNNPEFVDFFLTQKYLPQLSELGQYLANYGLVFFAPITYCFAKIKLDFSRLKRSDKTQDKLIAVINDLFVYFLIFFVIGQISVIRTVNSCYLFTLFMFPAALNILQRNNRGDYD